ncbi:diguanylate cyclase [Arcobacter suis]|uniref:PAS sensor-containing diguanylate cyclase/phosphodiesterase n=2 Tax=Arcobacter suis TaxID=1278212 RepID=A0AAD0SSM5_9BACT|nr:PAS sensor-containing diguanylate cyclase/phosphodiesterase [Arcobacter suis CECT 7833]RWS45597.1 diguanylate cyclase [Arcobacter suis]
MFINRILTKNDGQKMKIQIGAEISKQKELENQILKEKDDFINSFKILIDSILEGIIIYDENTYCIRVNAVAPKLLGYTSQEMIGKHALDFVAPTFKDVVKKVIQNHNQEQYEAELIRKDSSILPVILRSRDLVLLGKKIRVTAIIDMSEIKKKEKKILELAYYDSLTTLPNRLLLKDLLAVMIKRVERNNHYGALLFIDLDNFKMVNDTKGHDIGDFVLIETAKRLQNTIRETDLISRLGGDEFIIVLEIPESNKEVAINNINIAAKKILEEIKKPYLISNFDFRLTVSIGIALFENNEFSIDELMKFADTAMYSSKANGRNRFTYFDPILQQMVEQKAHLFERLDKAIEKESMILYYQPQIKIKNNQPLIVGMEALIRWNDEKIIPPNDFIPLAEETGLIIPLGKWILIQVMEQIKIWENDFIKKDWQVSVNISYKQFEKNEFLDLIKSLIEEYQINPAKLKLELTESLLIKNTQENLNKIKEINKLGVSLSIDDFGTGYSSLAYLKQLSISELKIDQSFIKDLVIDSNDFIIVETILSIGDKFNLEVVAEGVETKEQYEKLLLMGCSYFQGYLFGKPNNPNLL